MRKLLMIREILIEKTCQSTWFKCKVTVAEFICLGVHNFDLERYNQVASWRHAYYGTFKAMLSFSFNRLRQGLK